jgi:competence protein ComEC
MRSLSWLVSLLVALCLPCFAAPDLQIFFVDVEGGQATLIVSPSGQSMLVDAGWPGSGGRDSARIAAAAKLAGVERIDYLLMTHYHLDHVGGVPELAARVSVVAFVDHGPNTETDAQANRLAAAYDKARAAGKHLVVKAGDRIPLAGVDIRILAARGEVSGKHRGPGNPLCGVTPRKAADSTENARSIGFLLTLGDFRFVDLGDLTWNKELELACPASAAGRADVYLTTHHGLDLSNAPPIVHSLQPRVAVMNNGARKGGSPSAWRVIRTSPGLEDLWQLHYSVEGGATANSPEQFIANPEEKCQGQWIKLSARPDGSFTVVNSRNGFAKTYAKR